MAAVEVPSTAINIPRAGDPSSLYSTKRKRGRPHKMRFSTSPDNTELSDLNIASVIEAASISSRAPSVSSAASENASKSPVPAPSSLEHSVQPEKGAKAQVVVEQKAPSSPNHVKKASPPPKPQEEKQKAPAVKSQSTKQNKAPVSALKQPIPDSRISSVQWKIKLSIVEGCRKYYIEKQALPCLERPSVTNSDKLPLNKELGGQWFIVRQDRTFSKPIPAQLESVGKTRETRQANQKSYTKSRPPVMPKKGQLVVECFASGDPPQDEVQPKQLTYVRNIALDGGVPTVGAKTPLHLHCPSAENRSQDVVIVGTKAGCIHAISIFIPSADLSASWLRYLKTQSADNDLSEEGGASPQMKKRREELASSAEGMLQEDQQAISSQSSPQQKRRKVVWAEDVNVRYYISGKKHPKKNKNPQLDRCADVKLKCLDKVAKKKGSHYKFHQLELHPVPGSTGSPPSSPPSKSARAGVGPSGSPPPPPSMDCSPSNSNQKENEDEHVEIDSGDEVIEKNEEGVAQQNKPNTRLQEKIQMDCSAAEGKAIS